MLRTSSAASWRSLDGSSGCLSHRSDDACRGLYCASETSNLPLGYRCRELHAPRARAGFIGKPVADSVAHEQEQIKFVDEK